MMVIDKNWAKTAKNEKGYQAIAHKVFEPIINAAESLSLLAIPNFAIYTNSSYLNVLKPKIDDNGNIIGNYIILQIRISDHHTKFEKNRFNFKPTNLSQQALADKVNQIIETLHSNFRKVVKNEN